MALILWKVGGQLANGDENVWWVCWIALWLCGGRICLVQTLGYNLSRLIRKHL